MLETGWWHLPALMALGAAVGILDAHAIVEDDDGVLALLAAIGTVGLLGVVVVYTLQTAG